MDSETSESCLHLVMNANPLALDECRTCCGMADSIVLMNTAVTLLAGPSSLEQSDMPVPMFCLAADVHAHGLAGVCAERGVPLLDDEGLVDLVCQHRHCLSWK
ncbi:MAG TPA: DsrH/TusB family sulfur metabolism protein [Xanthomonadales bacterium]|nr:DsrH/TusB family sulfur metabolism protein [Xanthomonadales bacterium]